MAFGEVMTSRFQKSVLIGTILVVSAVAHAAVDDFDEEAPLAISAAAVDKASHRNYVGGRDDQQLEVQPALTIPTRAIDGVAAGSHSADADSDASHD